MTMPSPYEAYPSSPDPVDAARAAFRQNGGLGITAIILIAVVTLLNVLVVVRSWSSVGLATDYVQGTGGVTQDDLLGELSGLTLLAGLDLLALLAAGIVFWVWIWRARVNAEILGGPDSQRRRRGWTFWGWICPIANLFIPYQITADIYRASSPQRSARGGIVGLWWGTMLASTLISEIGIRFVNSGTDIVSLLHTDAVLYTVALICQIAAAALIGMIISQINAWQVPGRLADLTPQPQW